MNPSGGTVADFVSILKAIQSNARYLKNLDWGKLRAGHPEGTVRAHIEELEGNLARLRPHVSEEQADKLRVLIHVHDTFKAEALSGVAIADPRSHASIARAFLAEFCDDADLLAMVQNHDEPYALWKQHANKGRLDRGRARALFEAVSDWKLFTAFLIIDACTKGKDRAPIQWWLTFAAGRVHNGFTVADVLD